MRSVIGKALFVAIGAIALIAGIGLAQDPPTNLNTYGNYDDHIRLTWWPPGQTGDTLTVRHWSGAMTNAYAHWLGGDAWATPITPLTTDPFELWAIRIYILSETDPYWPWPNAIHEQLLVKAWGSAGSQPGAQLYSAQDGLANPSSTSWLVHQVNPPVTNLTGTIYVGTEQILANPNAEGMGVDPAVSNPLWNWMRIAGVWSSNATGGDLMFDALVYGNFGPGPAGARWVGPSGTREATPEELSLYAPAAKTQPAVAMAHEGPLPDYWQMFHPFEEPNYNGIQPNFAGTDVLSYYKIYRNGSYYAQTAGVVESYNDFGIVEGVQYNYAVSAMYIPEGESVQTPPEPGTANMAPGAPTNLVGTSNMSTTMTLTWTDPTVNANGTPCVDLAGLRVFRNAALIATVNPGIQTYVDTPPDPTALYTWSVAGIDEVPNQGAAAQFTGAVISPWQTIPFAWVEIAGPAGGSGVNTGLTADDGISAPFPLGFDFSHYGNAYNSIMVCTNGNLQFTTPTSTSWTNTTIPSAALPNNALYPFWDDLYLPSGGSIWYLRDIPNNRFIVEYYQVPHISGAGYGGPFTFEVILHSDGSMEYQYLTMGAGNFSATIGIENLAGTLAEQIQYNGTGPFDPDPFANVAVGWFMGGGGTPNVTIDLTPFGTPIVIPPTGGSFSFNIASTNNEATPQTYQVWSMITLPNGNPYGPVLGPATVTVPAGATLNRDRVQNVPGNAPFGNYVYNSHAGSYPATIYASDSFPFSKSQTGDGGAWVGEWASSGESFETLVAVTPENYILHGASPNPFNPTTTLSFALPQAGQVNLSVYNVAGRQVAELVNGYRDAGGYEVNFDASNLTSGIYIYRLSAGDFNATGKMVLLK